MEEIYRSKSTHIYDCGDGKLKIENEDGNRAYIDNDSRILDAIKIRLNGSRTLYYNKPNQQFYFSDWNNGYQYSLRQLIIAATMEGILEDNLEEVKRGRIALLNSTDTENLCRKNLLSSIIPEDNRLNTFWDDGKNFYIRHNPSGKIMKTNLDKNLNDIIKACHWYYVPKFNQMITQANIHNRNGLSLYHLIMYYQWFKKGKTDFFTWCNGCQKLLNKCGLSIDHLNTNRDDCTIENLVVMGKNNNSRKGRLTAKCNQEPFYCNAKSDGDSVILKTGYNDDIYSIKCKATYDTPEDFVNALKDYFENGIIPDDENGRIMLPEIPKEKEKANRIQ